MTVSPLNLVVHLLIALPVILAEDNGLLTTVSSYYSRYIDGFTGDVSNFGDNTRRSRTYSYGGDILDMVTDSRNKRLFILDGSRRTIYQLNDFTMAMNRSAIARQVLHDKITYSDYSRLAYDWLSENLYWTDSKFNLICMMSLKMANDSLYKVVVHEGLKIPSALTIDPIKRYLFFAEDGDYHGYIERANLDGSNRKMIITKSYRVMDMVPDIDYMKLYWVDSQENAIIRSNYDGSGKTIVKRKNELQARITSIDISRDVVCITEYAKYVKCYGKNSGDETWSYTYSYWRRGLVARVYDDENKKLIDHDCKNNDCEGMCVNTDSGAKCLCADGYILEDDNKTCTATHHLFVRGVVFANDSQLCMFDKSVLTAASSYFKVMCFMSWSKPITYIAVNANKTTIFFSDSTGIHKYNAVENITTTVTFALNISGLAFDWNEEYIYWIEKVAGKIKAMPTLDGQTTEDSTVYSGISNPSDLAIDPHNNNLFWLTKSNGDYNIQGGTFDGASQWNLANPATLNNPHGLYYDVTSERVFWINNGLVRNAKSDGSDTKTMHSVGTDDFLVIYKGTVISSDGGPNIIVGSVSNSQKYKTISAPVYTDISALAILDDTTQRFEKGPCESNNGGCEKICIPETKTQRRCECGSGYVLKNDKVNCTSVTMMRNFALTVDFTHSQILQIDLSNTSHYAAVDIKMNTTPVNAIYSRRRHEIYWADYVSFWFRKVDLNGANVRNIYKSDKRIMYGLAIDPSTDNIYYAASSRYYYPRSVIGVMDPRTAYHKTLITDTNNARSLAIYPSKGLLFYIGFGYGLNSGYITRMSMAGTHVIKLKSSRMAQPYSIALDYSHNGRVYWSDTYDEKIYSMSIDGSDNRTVLHDPLSGIRYIAISTGALYYTASNKQLITKAQLNNDGTARIVMWMSESQDFGRLEALAIYTRDEIPVHRECSHHNGMCSTFCLPIGPTTRKCECEDDVELLSDGRTCENVKKCDKIPANGQLNANCTGYVNITCQYSCNKGYEKINSNAITCKDALHKANWDTDVDTLCVVITTQKPTTLPTTTTMPTIRPPKAQTQPETTGINMTQFVVVILVIVVAFVILVVVILVIQHKRRGSDVLANAKFVNSKNFNLDPSNAEIYQTESDYTTLHSRGDGMENPLYDAKTITADEHNRSGLNK